MSDNKQTNPIELLKRAGAAITSLQGEKAAQEAQLKEANERAAKADELEKNNEKRAKAETLVRRMVEVGQIGPEAQLDKVAELLEVSDDQLPVIERALEMYADGDMKVGSLEGADNSTDANAQFWSSFLN